MNKREKRKILRRFCLTHASMSFVREDELNEYIDVHSKFWKRNPEDWLNIHCTICGEWHVLHPYNDNFPDAQQYPNLAERKIILNEPFPEGKDFRKKRTIPKMFGNRRTIQRFPKLKRRFGNVPDNGWFYNIISDRYVCFTCRKSWRNFYRKEDKRRMTPEDYSKAMQKCPHCGSSLQQVRPMFRAPKRNDIKAWKDLEKRYAKKQISST